MLKTFSVFHAEIFGTSNKLLHLKNKQVISLTLDVFHFDKSHKVFKELKFEKLCRRVVTLSVFQFYKSGKDIKFLQNPNN